MTRRRHSWFSTHPAQWRFAWRDTWSDLRNRLLRSPKFHLWASKFPLTRPIARARASALFDLCAGFVYTQVLYACVQLRVFEILAEGPQDIEELSPKLSLTQDKAQKLLDAAVALELLEARGIGCYGLGPQGAVLAGNPGIEAMISHHQLLYQDLCDPLALLRGEVSTTRLASYWPYAGSEQAGGLPSDQVRAYSELMAASQTLIAEEVLRTYSLSRHQRLLDVGGGSGAFLTAVAAQWPHLELMLFDLPAVVEQAKGRLSVNNLEQRVQCVGGDFYIDPLPAGADIISLIRIIHDHNDDDVVRLLTAIRRHLPDDGTLLLAEPMAGHKQTDRVANAYFGFYLMAMGKGRPRTPAEIGTLLKQAGFRRYKLLPNQMPLQTQIIIART